MIFHRFFFFLLLVLANYAYASYPYGQQPQQYPPQQYPPQSYPPQSYPQQQYPQPQQYPPQPQPVQQQYPPQQGQPALPPAPAKTDSKPDAKISTEIVSDPKTSVSVVLGGGFAARVSTPVDLAGLDVSPSLHNNKGFNFFTGLDYPLFSSPTHHVNFLYMLTKQYGTFSWSGNPSLDNYSADYRSTNNALVVGYAYHTAGSFIFNPFLGFNFSNPLTIPDLLRAGGGAILQGPTFQFGFKVDLRFKTYYTVGFMYSYFTPATYDVRASLDILPEGSFYETTLKVQGSNMFMLTLSVMIVP